MFYPILFAFATLAILITGLIFMAIGGRKNKKYGSTIMSLRVLFQALSIIALVIIYLYSK